ncbi:MAG: YbhB/YbcL family Raf kinase inhibitor-like protein [bacterium]
MKAVFLSLVLLAACAPQAGPAPVRTGFVLTSPAFEHEGTIPAKYSGDGENISPPLEWTGVPEGTASLALVCRDPDAREVAGVTWIHWVVYDIPVEAAGLPEAVPRESRLADGTRQGLNTSRFTGYRGPGPPRGRTHRYSFKLYALDAAPELPDAADVAALEEAMRGHILATAELAGRYGR